MPATSGHGHGALAVSTGDGSARTRVKNGRGPLFTGSVGLTDAVSVQPMRNHRASRAVDWAWGEELPENPDGIDDVSDWPNHQEETRREPWVYDSPSTMREYESLEIKEYKRLLDTLSVSGSVSIAGYGQQGDLMASYLNKESFEQSSFTYLIRINVKHQPMARSSYIFNPRRSIEYNKTAASKAYGDAYIKKFITGGAFYARVSIVARSQAVESEVGLAAKAAFSGWGVAGVISLEMKKGMSTLAKHSSIEISKMSLGQRKHNTPNTPRTTGEAIPSIIAKLKNEADEFYEDAVNHNSYLYALIDDYYTAEGFEQYAYEPNEYDEARRQSRDLLDRYLEFRSVEDLIMRTPTTQFRGHKSTRRKLQIRCAASINRVHAWIKATDKDPSQGLEVPDDDPWEFRKEVMSKIEAPRLKLFNNGGRYYVWDQLTWQKKPHALWEVEVYSKPVEGTVRLACGDSTEWAIEQAMGNALCVMDTDLPPNYITWFEAWVYNHEVANVTSDSVVELARIPFDNYNSFYGHNQLRNASHRLLEGDYLIFYPLAARRLREDSCASRSCTRYG
ncbi:hypothetical protein XA68_13222 [Ophiocordyceps unilateralis]|uniref:Uncharacterized protein n=1 Tax=Ophiocordyceps unilateralis TaxID=268505 RepID=A0A2A9PD33_OPHUN|nr:hypothetical protein XA68_13222 [Ophiocordyceps unilateralis]